MEKRFLVNRDRLKSQMVLRRMEQKDLATILSIGDSTVSRKMNGLNYFTEDEIIILKEKFGNSIFYGEVSLQE